MMLRIEAHLFSLSDCEIHSVNLNAESKVQSVRSRLNLTLKPPDSLAKSGDWLFLVF